MATTPHTRPISKRPTGALLVMLLVIIGAATAAGAQNTSVTTEDQKLTGIDADASDQFGDAVAIDGDTLVVGAPFGNQGVGSAYVFERSGSTWIQQATLTDNPWWTVRVQPRSSAELATTGTSSPH